MRLNHRIPRRGLTMIWALSVLSVVIVLSAALSQQILLDRRAVKQHSDAAQRAWLARAGVERAAERLLRQPAEMSSETVELLPRSQVRIEVKAEKDNVVLVTSEAHHPSEEKAAIKTITQRLQAHRGEGSCAVGADEGCGLTCLRLRFERREQFLNLGFLRNLALFLCLAELSLEVLDLTARA